MCTVLRDESVKDGWHKPVKRRKLVTMMYMHEANQIGKKTFCFLYGIGKDQLRFVKEHYLSNGLETRVHGNRKRLPHNYISIEAVNYGVPFGSKCHYIYLKVKLKKQKTQQQIY